MISFSILLVPIVGALLIFLTRRSASSSRWILPGAAVLQLALVVIAFLTLPIQNELLRPGNEIPLAPIDRFTLPLGMLEAGSFSYALSFSIGIDFLALPLLLLVTLTFAITAATSRDRHLCAPSVCALLLLLDGCVTGVLLAQDGLMLTTFTGGALFLAGALPAIAGGERGAVAARRFVPIAIGVTLVLGLVFGDAASRNVEAEGEADIEIRTFDLPTLVDRAIDNYKGAIAGEESRNDAEQSGSESSLLFVLLLVACASLILIVPFHPAGGDLIDSSSPVVSRLSLILLPVIGLAILIRCALLLFPLSAVDPLWRNIMVGAGCLTTIYASLVALGERRPTRIVKYLLIGWSGFSLTSLALFETAWIGGGLVGFFLCGVCAVGLLSLTGRMTEWLSDEREEELSGLMRIAPRWSILYGAGTAFLTLLPLLISIPILSNSVDAADPPGLDGSSATLWEGWIVPVLAGGLLSMFAAARLGWRLLFGEEPIALAPELPSDIRRRNLGWAIACGLLLGILAATAVIYLYEIAPEILRAVFEQREGVRT